MVKKVLARSSGVGSRGMDVVTLALSDLTDYAHNSTSSIQDAPNPAAGEHYHLNSAQATYVAAATLAPPLSAVSVAAPLTGNGTPASPIALPYVPANGYEPSTDSHAAPSAGFHVLTGFGNTTGSINYPNDTGCGISYDRDARTSSNCQGSYRLWTSNAAGNTDFLFNKLTDYNGGTPLWSGWQKLWTNLDFAAPMNVIAAGSAVINPADRSYIVANKFINKGSFINRGYLRVI